MDRIDPPVDDPTRADAPVDGTDKKPEQKSSVGDYVRELQQEYDEQQEEGKIDLADTD